MVYAATQSNEYFAASAGIVCNGCSGGHHNTAVAVVVAAAATAAVAVAAAAILALDPVSKPRAS